MQLIIGSESSDVFKNKMSIPDVIMATSEGISSNLIDEIDNNKTSNGVEDNVDNIKLKSDVKVENTAILTTTSNDFCTITEAKIEDEQIVQPPMGVKEIRTVSTDSIVNINSLDFVNKKHEIDEVLCAASDGAVDCVKAASDKVEQDVNIINGNIDDIETANSVDNLDKVSPGFQALTDVESEDSNSNKTEIVHNFDNLVPISKFSDNFDNTSHSIEEQSALKTPDSINVEKNNISFGGAVVEEKHDNVIEKELKSEPLKANEDTVEDSVDNTSEMVSEERDCKKDNANAKVINENKIIETVSACEKEEVEQITDGCLIGSQSNESIDTVNTTEQKNNKSAEDKINNLYESESMDVDEVVESISSQTSISQKSNFDEIKSKIVEEISPDEEEKKLTIKAIDILLSDDENKTKEPCIKLEVTENTKDLNNPEYMDVDEVVESISPQISNDIPICDKNNIGDINSEIVEEMKGEEKKEPSDEDNITKKPCVNLESDTETAEDKVNNNESMNVDEAVKSISSEASNDTCISLKNNIDEIGLKDVEENKENGEKKDPGINAPDISLDEDNTTNGPCINLEDDTECTDDKVKNPESMNVDEVFESISSKTSNETHMSKIVEEKTEPITKASDVLSQQEENKTNKSCINIDDDDDIMFIEDDVLKANKDTAKEIDEVNKYSNITVRKIDDDIEINNTSGVIECEGKDAESNKDLMLLEKGSENKEEIKTTESDLLMKDDDTIKPRPIIDPNLVQSYKTKFSEMTRDGLEEFCVHKIVEALIDRSNLSDVKSKLKTMIQHVEEWRKKSMVLNKQVRDLQIVLKAVQEEQKKRPEGPIVPLRITRSVGMQVLMSEYKSDKSRLRKAAQAQHKNQHAIATQSQKPPQKSPPKQTIPVPRLVPASVQVKPTKNPAAQQQSPVIPNNTGKGVAMNGVTKNSPTAFKQAEKRPFSSVQSVTVDLTDDEPPSKQPTPSKPTVPSTFRLVSPQQLMQPQPTFTPQAPPPQQTQPAGNTPRKVYIPIGGPGQQNQIKPGQTIMFKTVRPVPNPRHRIPMVNSNVRMSSQMRMASRPPMTRHPASLPECGKQLQPANWKALPPAPDLKISKVENGIVISWKIEGYQEDSYEEIASYQLYAYQETNAVPSTLLWKKIGDVKALALPMACTLTQFMAGYKYYFAVRAVDVRSRIGPFSLPGSILLLNK